MTEVTRPTDLPSDALWPVLADVRHWADWLTTVDAVRAVDPDRPDGVGASYAVDQPRLRRATWTVTAWEPGRGFTWESRSPGVTSTGSHELLAGPEGTTIRLALVWTGPLAGLVRRALGARARDYVTREAEALEATARARSTDA
ncbi:SRPBCC family protein [Phycicoccus flavus]|uniref:SRPBCC family protein n=1 Tax=Phycicoccus flavus TaxID=2502783 RepID=UPI000FEC0B11|nr:SRPBCC family protein [Phycicoccus flavus]NHA68971.1 polyketide cyclase [Phycicoccus flavus]